MPVSSLDQPIPEPPTISTSSPSPPFDDLALCINITLGPFCSRHEQHRAQALQALCPNPASVANLALPAHWAREFFLAALCLEQQQNQEALSKLQTLSQVRSCAWTGV